MKTSNNRGCYRGYAVRLCAAALVTAATAAAAQSPSAQAPGGAIVLQGTPGAPAQLTLPPAPSVVAPAAPRPPAAQVTPLAPPAAAAAPAAGDARAGVAPSAEAPSPPQAAAPGSMFPPQPPPAQRGLFNNWGNWWQDSVGYLGGKIKAARGKVDNLNKSSADVAKNAAAATTDVVRNAATATKDAAVAIVRLPATRVVETRQRCPTAPNGAPDCQVAAADICKGKGFGGGKPLDIQSSKACQPKAYLAGRVPAASECGEETVVLRALCQ